MTTDPLTDHEWIVAALELASFFKRKEGEVVEYQDWRGDFMFQRVKFPDGRVSPCHIADLPDLTSVDACLNHLVPVMKEKGFRLQIFESRNDSWHAVFWKNSSPIETTKTYEATEADLALAIVKAFVRAMKGAKE